MAIHSLTSHRCRLLIAAAVLCISCLPAHSQSMNVNSPAAMRAGANKATIDSFGKEQFWTFTAQPGQFSLIFERQSPQEGFSVGNKAGVAAVFAPKTEGAVLNFKDSANGTAFTGSVQHPTRVIVMVEPPKSPLVRQTTDYKLEASGAVSFSPPSAETAPSVTGVYDVNLNDYGAAKFTADGKIACTNGAAGSWEVFDAGTRTYIIKIDSNRWALTYEPGRGFIDKNKTLLFSQKQQMQ